MKVLVLATSSFASQELPEKLTAAGHEVWTFNRSAPEKPDARTLSGGYEQLGTIAAAAMQQCDVIINYAIVKNGSIEENLAQLDLIMQAARDLGVKRFVHISSISVLPSVKGTVNEQSVAVEARWKGIYSRIKAAAEKHVIERWKDSELAIVRPGFILARGLVDSMVGIGSKLPTGSVLGLGNRRSIIPLIHRDTVNAALVAIAGAPLPPQAKLSSYMLVAPNAPERAEYLGYQCRELGRGFKTLHFPAWMWRVGLACASPLLSLLKRRMFRLVKLFEHNLNVRQYDCAQTQKALGLDFTFDWKATLRELTHIGASPALPTAEVPAPARSDRVGYFGLGRIVKQKHLPGLARIRYDGAITWSDPVVTEPPQVDGLRIAKEAGISPDTTHVVIATPWIVRRKILPSLPASAKQVLIEKPFAPDHAMLDEFRNALAGRQVTVLHNYRFKPNMLRFRKFLSEHPSGALRAVSLHFETPSPAMEQASWMKQEKKNRVLLTDYAMHYLDVAWLFCEGPMTMHRCDVQWNDRGELGEVSADLSFSGVPCDILIRQGGHQRHCLIVLHFQNYSAEIRFFPDVFVPVIGGHGMVDDARLAMRGLGATMHKIVEKLGLGTADRSHDLVLESFLGRGDPAIAQELSLEALTPFYERLTTLADHIYG